MGEFTNEPSFSPDGPVATPDPWESESKLARFLRAYRDNLWDGAKALTPPSLLTYWPEITGAAKEAFTSRTPEEEMAAAEAERRKGLPPPLPPMSGPGAFEGMDFPRQPSTAEELAQLKKLLGFGDDVTGATGRPTSAATSAPSTTMSQFDEAVAGQKGLLTKLGGLQSPTFTSPDAETDLTRRFSALKYPARTPISELPQDAKAQALIKIGLGMMGTKSPFFAQGLAEGGTAGMADIEKSQEQQLKDALMKYGVESDQAAKLAGARVQDISAKNAQALSGYESNLKSLVAAGTINDSMAKTLMSKANAELVAQYHKELVGVRSDAAAIAAQARREASPIHQKMKDLELQVALQDKPEMLRLWKSIDKTGPKPLSAADFAKIAEQNGGDPMLTGIMIELYQEKLTPAEAMTAMAAYKKKAGIK